MLIRKQNFSCIDECPTITCLGMLHNLISIHRYTTTIFPLIGFTEQLLLILLKDPLAKMGYQLQCKTDYTTQPWKICCCLVVSYTITMTPIAKDFQFSMS